MTTTADIRDLFIQLLDDNNNAQVLPATVKSVTGATCIVELSEGLIIDDVRLRASDDDEKDGILITPAAGSSVLVGFIGNDINSLYVIGYSIIQDYNLKIKNTSLKLNKQEVIFNEGKNGGLIKIEELKKELGKLSKRVDGVIDAINNGVAVPQDGGTGLQTTIKTALATLVAVEDFGTIENEKIKH